MHAAVAACTDSSLEFMPIALSNNCRGTYVMRYKLTYRLLHKKLFSWFEKILCNISNV